MISALGALAIIPSEPVGVSTPGQFIPEPPGHPSPQETNRQEVIGLLSAPPNTSQPGLATSQVEVSPSTLNQLDQAMATASQAFRRRKHWIIPQVFDPPLDDE